MSPPVALGFRGRVREEGGWRKGGCSQVAHPEAAQLTPPQQRQAISRQIHPAMSTLLSTPISPSLSLFPSLSLSLCLSLSLSRSLSLCENHKSHPRCLKTSSPVTSDVSHLAGIAVSLQTCSLLTECGAKKVASMVCLVAETKRLLRLFQGRSFASYTWRLFLFFYVTNVSLLVS